MVNRSSLCVVATPIGNLGDITYRAVSVLRDADVILCEDTRSVNKIFLRYDIQLTGKKLIVYDKNQEREEVHAGILNLLKRGARVVLTSDAGCPGISDPGKKLVDYVVRHGIEVDSIPGPCAAVNAVVLAGFDCMGFAFLGFAPRTLDSRKRFFENIKRMSAAYESDDEGMSYVFYDTSERLGETLTVLEDILGNQQVVVAREMTKLHQQIIRGAVFEVQQSGILERLKGEIAVVVKCDKASGVEPTSSADLSCEMRALIAKGLPIVDIARIVSTTHGISRNAAYKLVCKLKAESA